MNSDDFKKVSVNVINGLITTILVFLVFVFIGLSYYLYQADIDKKRQKEKARSNWACGTVGRFNEPRSIHDTTKIDFENIELGKRLFRNDCAMCHNKNMRDDLVGPLLKGVTERWKDYPRSDLYGFIRNSQEMIKSGHPIALKLWNEWQPTIMIPFEDLSDEEIEAIISYIEY
jgi:cytochrome c2